MYTATFIVKDNQDRVKAYGSVYSESSDKTHILKLIKKEYKNLTKFDKVEFIQIIRMK